MFIDRATIRVRSGSGGNGCVSFRREKHVPRGGPDGGDGGDGGNVVVRADGNARTLLDVAHRQHYAAERGQHGKGKRRHGKNGADAVVVVPVGTVLKDAGTGAVLADLTEHNKELVLVEGGRGGRGNAVFATAARQAPDWSEKGTPGQEKALDLELKLIADVGLVGLPNAGKSTLLSRLSAARPKIADYPFTTVEPCLGIVALGEFDTFAMADIPGLLEGAHEGRGLGFQFLRHIERTRILLFLVDVSSEHPQYDLDTLEKEVKSYSPRLLDRPRVVALSKMDLIEGAQTPRLETDPRVPLVEISSVTGQGLKELVSLLGRTLQAAEDAPRPIRTPRS